MCLLWAECWKTRYVHQVLLSTCCLKVLSLNGHVVEQTVSSQSWPRDTEEVGHPFDVSHPNGNNRSPVYRNIQPSVETLAFLGADSLDLYSNVSSPLALKGVNRLYLKWDSISTKQYPYILYGFFQRARWDGPLAIQCMLFASIYISTQ